MNTPDASTNLSPQEFSARLDAAKQRAHELRREATDAYWSSLVSALRSGWGALRRAQPTATSSQPQPKAQACPR